MTAIMLRHYCGEHGRVAGRLEHQRIPGWEVVRNVGGRGTGQRHIRRHVVRGTADDYAARDGGALRVYRVVAVHLVRHRDSVAVRGGGIVYVERTAYGHCYLLFS